MIEVCLLRRMNFWQMGKFCKTVYTVRGVWRAC